MVNKAVGFFLFRILLPFALIAAVICRQNVLSFGYLLLLLASPVVSLPSPKSMAGHTGHYLKAVLGYSLAATIAQITFQIVLFCLPPYGHFLENCAFLETLLRHLGFQRYDHIDILQAARLIGPEVLMLIVSVAVFVPCAKLADASSAYAAGDTTSDSQLPLTQPKARKRRTFTILSTLGDIIAMALLASAGIIRPSITSATYFLAFLAIATWVACNKKLRRKFAYLRVFLLIYAGIHLVVLYIYQMPILQTIIPPESLYARLFGLTSMVITQCSDPRNIQFLSLEWATYVNPAILLALYWVLVMETRLWLLLPPITEEVKPFPGEGDARIHLGGIYPVRTTETPSPHPFYTHPQNTPRASLQVSQSRLRRTKSEKPPSMSRRTKSVRRKPTTKRNLSFDGPCEATPLLSADGVILRYSSTDGVGDADHRETDKIEIDPNGSVILSNVDTDAPTSEDHGRLVRLRQLMSPVISIFLLITRQSYIATLIIMMITLTRYFLDEAYSITYVSWLTFVLLLWSCVLWMIPNSRKACLRSSPFLVIYAEALLIIQYIYGLSLNNDELPEDIDAVNLQQIGLMKYASLPCLPLAVRTLYTVMFWITMRQYMEERFREQNRDITEGVMLQPFNMAYNTAQAGTPRFDVHRQTSVQSSPFMKKLGDFVLSVLTTYWIWVVACMLMVISLQGEKVVIFRIMYMALFLFFILIFQLSYRLWRVTMYFFWLTVIIYSMLVLILIYTYQFEYFPDYWSTYLGITPKLQKDIGLEVYNTDPGQLFLKLLQPTFFVVITIIQLHYFHKDFLRMSDIDRKREVRDSTPPEIVTTPSSDNQGSEIRSTVRSEPTANGDDREGGSATTTVEENESSKLSSENRPVIIGILPTPTGPEAGGKEIVEGNSDEQKIAEEADSKPSSWKDILLYYIKVCSEFVVKMYNSVSEFLWRFLEIHMIKIVLFAALMLAVYDVCAVHVIFVFLVTAALPFRGIQLFVSHCCAIWSSVLLISKMIYQIDYIEEVWKVNCTEVQNVNESFSNFPYPFNDTINNAHWMGYKKVSDLPDYLKGYIGLILVLSIQAVVRVRQRYHRNQTDEVEPKPGVVFPDITRMDADNGLIECLKYLVNYAFYKYGVEICLITNVAVIGVRLDIFAVIYAMWLGGLFLLKRTTLACVWPFYVTFLAVLLPIQYCMCVGMPAGFCIEYPWNESFMNSELREWLYLPDFVKKLAAYKLAVDFFLLLFACCQLVVFQIESSPMSESYEGGSNREIIYIGREEPEENPIPDFATYTKSYLDLVKVVVFSLFYWITLAIIFLAGTNRVSLFAMGYVIGCFLFLWNGQEFYLKPLKTILRLWNTLVAYNIFVIFTKAILQMVGCVYITEMRNHYCWAIQLFGIACLKKFDSQYSSAIAGGDCEVPEDQAGLLWDGICLAFMLMQRRLFCSYYFHHLVVEMHAQTKLASRGAELINQLLTKEVKEQEAAEREIVEKIKKKMDRIRANQRKIRGKEYSEAQDHFQAIRSGDYFMFEEYSDDGLAELEYQEKKSDEKDEDLGGMTVSKLLSSAMKSDIKHAVSEAKHVKDSQSPDAGTSRHTSSDVSGRPPVSRTVSAVSGASSLPVGMSVSRQASLRSQGYAEMDRPPAFPSLHDGREDYDDYGGVEGEAPRSPPLQDLEAVMKDEEGDLEDEDEHPPESPVEEEGFYRKVIHFLKFAWAFIEGVLVSLTARLNIISKDYRYVAKCLTKEKKQLKEKGLVSAQSLKADFTDTSTVQPPSPQLQALIKSPEEPLEIRVEKASEDQTDESMECVDTPEQLEKEFEKEQPVAVRFAIALWYALVSRSEIVCYIMIIINQIKSASLLSLPLPFMVFLWGSLSIPRPTKTFWVTIITYTEAVVVIKYLFQFDFFPWNEGEPRINPFWAPKIIGVEKKELYAVYDLLLLLVVFFHRFILKSLGLWKDECDASAQSVDNSEDSVGVHDESKFNEKTKKSVEDMQNSLELAEREEGTTIDEEYEEEEEKPATRAALNCILNYIQPFRRFFHNLFHPSYRVTVDVYAYMFVCDFITFLILVFGYWAFGTGGGEDGVASYFEENKVPIPFLVMLIAQFGLIIIDRALFLRKYIVGKVIFQVFMVFLIHIWMFFVLPMVSEREFNSSLPPQLWYLVKCVYLMLSAYQIRSGYPTRILGNFLTKKYNYLNLFLFRGFMAVPFLFELRALMDWIWTDTSMSLSSWLKMEDIFANIFILKCQRRAEAEYPTPRGEKRNPLIKYGVGGLLLFIIIFIIWFPLVLFALGNTVGMPNPPYDVTVEITFGGYQPLFRMSAQHAALKPFTEEQYYDMVYFYRKQRDATAFLQNFDHRDFVLAELSVKSTAVWGISPPSQQNLIEDLMSQNRLTLKFAWYISRNSSSTDVVPTITDERPYVIEPKERIREQLALMINGSNLHSSILIPDFFPKFIRVPGKGSAPYAKQLIKDNQGNLRFSNLTMSLESGAFGNDTYEQQWWKVEEDCTTSYFQNAPFQKDCDHLTIITVNDKVFPSTLSYFSGMGIIGVYTTLVLVASRFVRGLFAGVSFHIMFDDMPYVDRVLQLCMDIYLVRESGELHLEEDLFAKLIFLYRSPETLIKWTRFPQHPNSP